VIEERTAAPRAYLEKQLDGYKEEMENRLLLVQQAQAQLKAWAETCGPEALELLQTLRHLMQYEALVTSCRARCLVNWFNILYVYSLLLSSAK
jgi:hypothetical protein